MWNWARGLRGRLHGELSRLEDMIKSTASLTEGECKWVFKPSGKETYCSKSVASSIDALLLGGNSFEPETLRNNLIPQKLGIFVWWALKNRLPTRVELEKRGVHIDSLLCPLCNKEIETVEHAIFECDHAKMVWDRILKWWEVSPSINVGILNAFRGTNIGGRSTNEKRIWQAIEWITGYSIWKNRNLKVFSNDN
ncbi:uncharacterized protein [Rutidosis leptorrhynchoides]|uniref:uncharacterized protein n=1 Tax=Rutidosis leptorrhynchoides TaxID=125765 RepID=UPI003A99D8A7